MPRTTNVTSQIIVHQKRIFATGKRDQSELLEQVSSYSSWCVSHKVNWLKVLDGQINFPSVF